ncbi:MULTISPECIES: hemerythrin domain-containing protein [unclassified Streptomyces]|uniref:hemerythrin domain-containing protein n=1 Tax=unclassified Streptomyces TaxID=2593676 RepID=UPI000A9CB723|nr:hemerythrin domain-containing protein [Streptomyces sp. NRRL F-5727]
MPDAKNDMTGFLLTHELIRTAVPELSERLAATAPADREAVLRLRRWWGLFAAILDRHHEVEDRLVWPVAIAAAPGLADAVAEIEAQHDGLDAHLEQIATGLDALSGAGAEGWAAAVGALRRQVDVLAAVMEEHLLLEERTMVPALESAVTPAAFAELGAALARDHSPGSMATEMPMVVAHADPVQREVMLSRMPEPVRSRFTAEWEPRYRELVASLPGGALPRGRRG